MSISIEALQTDLIAHKGESDRRHKELYDRLEDAEVDLARKVDYRDFRWIIGIIIAVLGVIMLQLLDIQVKGGKTEANVANLYTVLKDLPIDYQK